MNRRRILMTALMAFFLVMTISFPALGAKTIKIGVIGPMRAAGNSRLR